MIKDRSLMLLPDMVTPVAVGFPVFGTPFIFSPCAPMTLFILSDAELRARIEA